MDFPTGLQRAYSVLHVKALDAEQRTITGLASSPEPDRMGDIVEPLGVTFKNPVSLLLHHDKTRPVGTVRFDKPTKEGITFSARLPVIDEPGPLKDRVDEAWQSIKSNLLRGVSIGFRPLNDAIDFMQDTGGFRFRETELLELSLVSVPAHQLATIQTIKSLDVERPAKTGTPVVRVTLGKLSADADRGKKDTAMAFTIGEQIKSFENSRAAKSARMTELMEKAGEAGSTLDAPQAEEYDNLEAEVKAIDDHLRRLSDLEKSNVAKATAVPHVKTVEEGGRARAGHVSVAPALPPGIEFARALMCKMQAVLSGGAMSAIEIAKERFPDSARIQMYLKGAVPAGTTTEAVWASPLVDQTNLAGEFIEYLRPMTILGKFGQNGIPALRRVPFNVRVTGQTSGGNAYWVGQGAPKPLTSFAFNATTLLYTKIAAIAVITEELARFSTPSAETLVRDALVGAVIERMDRDFIDPDVAAVTGVNPASITNGVTPLSSAGTSADNIRTDLANLLEQFIVNNQNPSGIVLIMPQTLALAAAMLVNDLGNPEFPGLTMNGGTIKGLPVITSQYAANESGGGNLVVAVNATEVFLADDGQVTVDASREASLQMLDNPTNNSASATPTTMVSMFQTNSIALRAERFINWAKRRATAVSYLDDVNWGSIGSP